MVSYYCIFPYLRPSYLQHDYDLIRLFIFLISGVCVGFPALLWAFGALYPHYKTRGRISFIVIFLLLSDLLELILSLVYLIYLFYQNDSDCTFSRLFFGIRLCGYQLHQLVALEGILTQKYPSLAHLFSTPCSIVLCIIVFLVGIGFSFTSVLLYPITMLSVLPVLMCAVTCLVTCKASPETNQATDGKSGVLVLSVAMFTLIILYLPFFLNIFIHMRLMLDSLVSMRLFSEPLLCVLICLAETAHTQ